jgi:hypothetical protein
MSLHRNGPPGDRTYLHYGITKHAVRSVPCPYCHAREFRPCRLPSGVPLMYGHMARRRHAADMVLCLLLITGQRVKQTAPIATRRHAAITHGA